MKNLNQSPYSRLGKLINSIGVENVRFLVDLTPIQTFLGFISFTSSSTPEIPMLCEIDESRYKLADDYKLTLRSIEQIKGIKGSRHFYMSDLQQMIDDGQVKMMVELNSVNKRLFKQKVTF